MNKSSIITDNSLTYINELGSWVEAPPQIYVQSALEVFAEGFGIRAIPEENSGIAPEDTLYLTSRTVDVVRAIHRKIPGSQNPENYRMEHSAIIESALKVCTEAILNTKCTKC